MKPRPIFGDQCGDWTVKETPWFDKKTNAYYALCACVCGEERAVKVSSLTSGRSKSCGCAASRKSRLVTNALLDIWNDSAYGQTTKEIYGFEFANFKDDMIAKGLNIKAFVSINYSYGYSPEAYSVRGHIRQVSKGRKGSCKNKSKKLVIV